MNCINLLSRSAVAVSLRGFTHHTTPVGHELALSPDMLNVFLVLEWIVFLLPVIFIIRYTILKNKWWLNPGGLTIVALDMCLIIVLGNSLATHYIWHDEPAIVNEWLGLGVLVFISVIIAYRLVSLEVRNWKRKHSKEL